MGEPSAAHSEQGFGVHHRTTHAHKGAESKALSRACAPHLFTGRQAPLGKKALWDRLSGIGHAKRSLNVADITCHPWHGFLNYPKFLTLIFPTG